MGKGGGDKTVTLTHPCIWGEIMITEGKKKGCKATFKSCTLGAMGQEIVLYSHSEHKNLEGASRVAALICEGFQTQGGTL